MRIRSLLGLACLLAAAWPAGAADLSKIDAPLTREPAYQSAAPRYCLLVFGPEAKTRVWVVIDGDNVYVDRNGNGDLTEAGEKVALSKASPSSQPGYLEEREVGGITITDGRLKHTGLQITQYRPRPDLQPKSEAEQALAALVKKDPQALVYNLRVQVEMAELPRGKIAFSGRVGQYAGEDAQGYLQFAARPQDAPVIHFGGPWEMALLVRQTLPCGGEPGDLQTMVGTRGRGPGSFASVSYLGLISDEAHPVAEVQFPNREAGKEPVKTRVVLKHRC